MQYRFFKDNVTLELKVTPEGRFVHHIQTGTLYAIGERVFNSDLCLKFVQIITKGV